MTTAVEIPLLATPQTFAIALGGVTYQLTVRWNDIAGYWVLDIADSLGNRVLSGVPLVTGADLLAQYDYLNFPGQLIVQTDNDTDALPTFTDLGTTAHLYFVTP